MTADDGIDTARTESFVMSDVYQVKLDGLFEGPMDLLVHLIKKNDVDIYDIPIAAITDQFLQTLELLQALNIDLAGDFLVMAATLTQIKSRMLLPYGGDEDGDEDDPRLELIQPLQEYLEMKAAAEVLSAKHQLGVETFTRKPARSDIPALTDPEMIQVGLFELIDAFQKVLERMAPDHRVDFSTEGISVKDRINQLVDILESRGSATFDELFDDIIRKSDIIVTFLAILEMAKLELIRVAQHAQTGIIRVFYQ